MPDNARPSQNAHASGKRPKDQDNVDRYPGDNPQPGGQAEGTEQRCNNQRKQSVTDDANCLEKGSERC